MPTYAYVCTACAHSFEAVQAITDDALTECPSCGGQLRKKFHPVGVTFKGSGFYRTDSRGGESEKTSAGSAGSDSKGGESKGDSSGGKTNDSKSSTSTPSTSTSSGSGSGSSGGATKSAPASTSSSS